MAGLSVVLETQNGYYHHQQCTKQRPQILVKSSMLLLHHPFISSPTPTLNMPSYSNFLEHCYQCRKHLSQEKDIYMYRGDRAFCSVECRNSQILMEEESLVREKSFKLSISHPSKGNSNNTRAAEERFALLNSSDLQMEKTEELFYIMRP